MKIAVVTSLVAPNIKSGNLLGIPPFADTVLEYESTRLLPPVPLLGPAMLATALREAGFEDVHILDFFVCHDAAVRELSEGGFDLIGIHTSFMGQQLMKEVGELCRKANPEAVIVAGGPESVAYPGTDEVFDYFVMGEGDDIIVELAKALVNGKPLESIEGVYKEGCPYGTRTLLDVKALPFPDWSLFDLDSYLPLLPVQTMRGCPFSCNYCKEQHFWRKPVRMRDVSTVVDEIERNVKEFGIKTFRFVDSTLTNPPKRTKRMCREIMDRGLDIKWSSYARAEAVDAELAELMVEAGCVALNFGIESGSQTVLDKMNKALTVDQIRRAITACRASGVLAHTNFIIGFPGESQDTIKETVALIKEIRPTTFCFHPLMVQPGTELYDRRAEYNLVGEQSEWRHETMQSDEVKELVRSLYDNHFTPADGSYYCFGGEHLATVMTALGKSRDEIVSFYEAFNVLCCPDHYPNALRQEKSHQVQSLLEDLGKYRDGSRPLEV